MRVTDKSRTGIGVGIAAYSTKQKKLIAIFCNGVIAAKYIRKQESNMYSINCYASNKGCILAKTNRFNERIAIRFATREQTEMLKGNKFLVLDNAYDRPDFRIKNEFGNEDESDRVKVRNDEATRKKQERKDIIKIKVTATKNWQRKSYQEIAAEINEPAGLIGEIFRDMGIVRHGVFKAVNNQMALLKKNIDKTISKIGKDAVVECLKEYIQ